MIKRNKPRGFHSSVRQAIFCVSLPFCLAFVGCSTNNVSPLDERVPLDKVSIEKFADVHAELDFENATARTPISDYLIGHDFLVEVRFAKAAQKFLEGCMTQKGFDYPGFSSVKWESLRPGEDRLFGQWDVKAAAKYGLELDPSRGVPKSGFGDDADKNETDAIEACVGDLEAHDAMRPLVDELTRSSIADRIFEESAFLAEESPEGKEASQKFTQCMKERGLVLDRDSGYVSSEYRDRGKEAEITAAVGEAECNVKTGRVQTMYDLRARYEAAYIEKFESQLKAVQGQKREILAKLDAIVAGAKK